MSNDTTTTQDGTRDGDVTTPRPDRPRRRARSIWLGLAGVLLAAVLAWWCFLPPNNTGGMPSELPEQDKKEIAALLRGFTVRHAFRVLLKGEIRQCIRALKISRKQRINRFIDDRDGTFRAYTVVDSPKEADGWYAWSRHSLCKTNGHWVILSSY